MLFGLIAGPLVQDTLALQGKPGPGSGKHVVLLAGDEEYRSEEMLPQLARILSERHGFRCTVVFSVNKKGEIDPNERHWQPGIEALRDADACVMMLRFRSWPDEQMKEFVDYYLAGKPIIALRTSTHAFDYPAGSTSRYRDYGWGSTQWTGGFGEQVLGENWVSHWGDHGRQATRGVTVAKHPALNGVSGLFGTTDVYEAAPPADATVLVRGEVVEGLGENDPGATNRKKTAQSIEQSVNDPMMPIVWVRDHKNEAGKVNRVFTSTMGAATDFLNEGFRRLLVNSVYWATDVKVPSRANVDLVGTYAPSPFGFDKFRPGVRPGGS